MDKLRLGKSELMVSRIGFGGIPIFSGWLGLGMEKAAKCGECEPRCPYNLPIMEMVEQSAALYEAEKTKYLERTAAR